MKSLIIFGKFSHYLFKYYFCPIRSSSRTLHIWLAFSIHFPTSCLLSVFSTFFSLLASFGMLSDLLFQYTKIFFQVSMVVKLIHQVINFSYCISKLQNFCIVHFYNFSFLPGFSVLSFLAHIQLQFGWSVMSDSLWPHGLQHTRPPCPSPTPRIYPNSYPLSQWCHPTISSCHLLLLSPSIFPSIRVFSNESTLRMRWPKYWSFSFSISPSSEYPGLISFRMNWLDLLAVQGTNSGNFTNLAWKYNHSIVQ